MTWLVWMLIVAALFVLASAIALYSYGRFAKRARGAPSRALVPGTEETALDRAVAPLTAANRGRSGLCAVAENADSFALRARSARAAGRSLDMLYYI